MRSLIHFVVFSVVSWYAVSATMMYSATWDSQANPTKNVTVHLKDGSVIVGLLSTGWHGQYVLQTNDNHQIEFTEFNSIAIGPRADDDRSFLLHWRGLLPLFFVSLLILAWSFVQINKAFGLHNLYSKARSR